MDKVRALQQIAEEVRNLERSPLYAHRQEHGFKAVPGEGSPDAAFVFVGEAPGKQEAEQGRPFVGSAGRVLEELLESVGLTREGVYITNVVKDRPPHNRDLRQEEIDLYAPFLRRQLEIIQPRVIVTLGRFAMRYIMEAFGVTEAAGKKIGELHGQVFRVTAPYDGEVLLVPLYHPAAGFYNPEIRSAIREDIEVLEPFVAEAREE